MAESDYIVAAMPFTPLTHKLIDAEAICSMKKSGVLINVGRGQTIDEDALIKGSNAGVLHCYMTLLSLSMMYIV